MEKADFSLEIFNEWLYSEWSNLPYEIKSQLTHPYLVTPTEEYLKSKIRVMVINRETNLWGEKQCMDYNLNRLGIERLKKVYIDKINTDWNILGSVWPMYFALRQLSEGDNPLPELKGKVGFIHSNVALIGKKEGTGYCPEIKKLLIEAIGRQIQLLNPNIILLGIGFGNNTETAYTDILSETYLGKYSGTEPCTGCNSLYKISFASTPSNLTIFGCPHPQGLSYAPIVEYLTKIFRNRIFGTSI